MCGAATMATRGLRLKIKAGKIDLETNSQVALGQ
jgi:hypothetical protein